MQRRSTSFLLSFQPLVEVSLHPSRRFGTGGGDVATEVSPLRVGLAEALPPEFGLFRVCPRPVGDRDDGVAIALVDAEGGPAGAGGSCVIGRAALVE